MNAWDEDAEGYQSAIMAEGTHLGDAAQVEVALKEACKLFTDSGNPPPPLPARPGDFAPCSILVTERSKPGTGERIGRIQFLAPNGSLPALFDAVWQIAPGR